MQWTAWPASRGSARADAREAFCHATICIHERSAMKKTTRNDVTRLSLASIRRVSGDELQRVTGGDGPSQPSQTAKGIIDSIGR
jgi:hypothetical protein